MGDYWKATAQAFGGLITKPKMTEKLLSKPPFKYIFDIIMQTSNKTNFAAGLFSGQQLQGDYYNDKDRKLEFLEKVIKLVQAMQGTQIKAKPQKIVAGMEPEATNAFLQLVYKCATSGKSSDPYVAKLLGGGAVEEPEPKKKQVKPEPKEQKKKVERPPSARTIKKNEIPSKKSLEKPQVEQHQQRKQQQVEPQQPKIETKKQNQNQKYSQKIRKLQQQGEQQVQAQKQAQVTEDKNKKDINMGRLGKKKQKNVGENVVSSTGDLTDKQLDLVKSMIQSICQNTAPLGKSVQFINDDIQSMNKQLVYWRKQYNSSKSKLQNQLKITQEALLPIYDKLTEIQNQIKDQKAKIQNGKAQILKNDSTLRDLLMSIVVAK